MITKMKKILVATAIALTLAGALLNKSDFG
jgi:hypothetical protein|nr:MAG TPA: Prokaryotic membrane lipoprotein lipid attachment site [Bacteriophage sp.]